MSASSQSESSTGPTRARDLGVPFEGRSGLAGAITDVPGVAVGYRTLIAGEGRGAVRTGVTAILPRGRSGVGVPCAAAVHSFNGNGELTGRSWIEESGSLTMPIGITSSHAVGAVHAGIAAWVAENAPHVAAQWMLPVVGETWDGYLNDINGGHVSPADARAALEAASPDAPEEGNVGGGTGMNCYGFKGGTGTASRVVAYGGDEYTVGVLIQANFGSREELRLGGIALGPRSSTPNPMEEGDWLSRERNRRAPGGAGSAIVVIATDAPLLPGQCAALARRGVLGLGRSGTAGSHFSGDIVLAFSTANEGAFTSVFPDRADAEYETLRMIPWGRIDPFLTAAVQAVDEAVWNALVAAQDMTGRDGHVSHALPHAEVRAAVSQMNGL
ncbi:P1 family peptidase [Microbacterium oxydans]|uniref:DmpA family aminopeptidase n=1 Tax=Microbacterium oxydans TaxID=82380 RepID=UPI0022B20F57|nr:P1 family peptidase [Microbacterium oxydans]MCZ4300686.1 P1 family peptidase [Microbacterium oxydans]